MPLGFALGGLSLVSGGLKIGASRKRRKAAQARRQINKIKNFQAKRTFINNFLTAQSTSLARGAISGADIGSSGVQGELASQATQARVGVLEVNEQQRLGDVAASNEAKASRLSGAASFIGSAASAASLIASEFPSKAADDGTVG